MNDAVGHEGKTHAAPLFGALIHHRAILFQGVALRFHLAPPSGLVAKDKEPRGALLSS